MEKLTYSVKFGMIFLVILIPVVTLSGIIIKSELDEVNFLEKERMGLEYYRATRPLIEFLPIHRGLTNTYLHGNITVENSIFEARKEIDNAFATLSSTDAKLNATLDSTSSFTRLKNDWNNIKTNSLAIQAKENFAVHSHLIDDLLKLIVHVADTSGITLDPDIDSYYLGDVLVNRIPVLANELGIIRGVGAGIAAEKFISNEQKLQLSILIDRVEFNGASLKSGLKTAIDSNSNLNKISSTFATYTDETHKFENQVKENLINTRTIDIDSKTFFEMGSSSISSALALYDIVEPSFEAILNERIQFKNMIILASIAIAIGVLLMVTYCFSALFFSIKKEINAIVTATEKLSDGNLTARVHIKTKDEMSIIAKGFNHMATTFSGIVEKMSGVSDTLASSSTEVSTVSRESSVNIDRQRNETAQVATAITEMTAVVQEVAASAENALSAAQHANVEATKGSSVVLHTTDAIQQLASTVDEAAAVIEELESDSANISTILDVIKSIAEQTNLLALNAAIEAARAGEQGRGFAVVADEVRTLASRTQESTTEIETMIDKLQSGSRKAVSAMEKGKTQAHTGVEKAAETREALDKIVSSVSTIADLNTQIASAAEEQAVTTNEISQNITNISDMAENTATAAVQTTQVAENFNALSEQLQELVLRFKTEK